MSFDPDGFLVSNDFDTIECVFVSNKTIAVTFPVFRLNYKLC